jgi:hypothetical protein
MSTLPNATNSAPGTTFTGSGGGSNFPQGVQIANQVINTVSYFADNNVLSAQDTNSGIRPFVAFPLVSGFYDGGYTRLNTQSIDFQQPQTGVSVDFALFDSSSSIALTNISTINGKAPINTVNVSTANVKGSAIQVDPNTTTVIGSDSLPNLPTGSNILIQATIGLGGLTGSNVQGHVQYGVGFSNSTPIFCPPVYINTNDPFTISSIQISGILNNVSTTNTLLLIGSNAANNSMLYTAELASLSLTPL